LWKALSVLGLIAAAITAHQIKLPAGWEAATPYIEFTAGVVAIITAAYMQKPGSAKTDDTKTDQ
jgi:hypothetical protein